MSGSVRTLAALVLALAANALLALGVAALVGSRAGRFVPRPTPPPLRIVLAPPPEADAPESPRPPPRVQRKTRVHTAGRVAVPAPASPAVLTTARVALPAVPFPHLAAGALRLEEIALGEPGPPPDPTALPGVEEPPRKAFAPPPPYPAVAQRRGLEGTVRIRLLVDERGQVSHAEVIQARPPGVFERVVLETVRRWRFHPARARGRPVPCWCEQTFEFSLWRRAP